MERKVFPWQGLVKEWVGTLTTRQAGRVLGLSHTTLRLYLSGERCPNARKARRLARAMGLEYDQILSAIIDDRREKALAKWSKP